MKTFGRRWESQEMQVLVASLVASWVTSNETLLLSVPQFVPYQRLRQCLGWGGSQHITMFYALQHTDDGMSALAALLSHLTAFLPTFCSDHSCSSQLHACWHLTSLHVSSFLPQDFPAATGTTPASARELTPLRQALTDEERELVDIYSPLPYPGANSSEVHSTQFLRGSLAGLSWLPPGVTSSIT